MEMDIIPLNQVVDEIAKALRQAQADAEKRGGAIMKFEECELEFAVQVESEAGGGLKVWVLEFKAGMKRNEANTIKLKFKALDGIVASAEAPAGTRKPIRRGIRAKNK
jgi:methionine synthase II (cobalamin-independent)